MMQRVAAYSVSGLWLLVALLGACGSEEVCRRDPTTGWENCQTVGGDYGEAAGTAVAAGAAWAAVGCTVNGCEPPAHCNERTKLCEAMPCSDTTPCQLGYQCDLEQGVCR